MRWGLGPTPEGGTCICHTGNQTLSIYLLMDAFDSHRFFLLRRKKHHQIKNIFIYFSVFLTSERFDITDSHSSQKLYLLLSPDLAIFSAQTCTITFVKNKIDRVGWNGA